MSNEFRETINQSYLDALWSTYAFINDIFLVRKGTQDDLCEKVRKALKTFNEANSRMKRDKSNFFSDGLQLVQTFLMKRKDNLSVKLEGIIEKLKQVSGRINRLTLYITNLRQLFFFQVTVLLKTNYE